MKTLDQVIRESRERPKRVQLSRRAGSRKPASAVVVARPSRYGNPCRVGMFKDYTAADAVRDFRRWLERDSAYRSFDIAFGTPPTIAEIQRDLRGKDLACWCALDAPCHADVLLDLANRKPSRPAAQ